MALSRLCEELMFSAGHQGVGDKEGWGCSKFPGVGGLGLQGFRWWSLTCCYFNTFFEWNQYEMQVYTFSPWLLNSPVISSLAIIDVNLLWL